MIAAIDNLAEGFGGIGLAFALGLLAGVQRGWAQRMAADGTRFAGVRTFGLLGLAGGIGGHLVAGSPAVATIVLATTAALILASYWRAAQAGTTLSGTASIAGLIVLAGGFMAATGERLLATAIVVVMVLLLSMRERLHALVERMSEVEVAAFARFALIAAVILPLLPDSAFGPFDAWNPRQLWLVVVLVCGFSLLGYVAARLLGPSRATLAVAAAGSVVSSTAVSAALAADLRKGDGHPAMLNAAVAVASAVMFARVMTLVFALAPFALPTFAALALPGLIASLAAAGLFLWRGRGASLPPSEGLRLRNPFDIGPALLLMALVMAMTLAARWVLIRYGDAELAIVLALSGSVDVDSAIITMGNLPQGALSARTAGLVLLPPVLLNTLFKAGTMVSIAGWRRGWPAAAALVGAALASLAVVPLVI
ncbi:MAG: hypothetical protein RIQ46_1083 [Pseudomonadota bacterium]|jgi:uncharacterized membrane protein (DUF4010 family)